MKILVIDDDSEILELVSQYLALAAHHEVQSALSARAALDLVNNADQPFDCFLVDIQMRGVDGISLVELLRETAQYRSTPILMLTAMQDKRYIDRAFAAGASDYVMKPFDFNDLDQRLKNAVGAARKADDQEAAPCQMTGPSQDGSGETQLALAEPIALAEVKSAISYSKFQNYLKQVQIKPQQELLAIAVKIGSAQQVHAKLSAAAFQSVIRDVALAVEEILLAKGGFLTYAGDGTFFCVPQNRLKGHHRAVQKALNKSFQLLRQSKEGAALNLLIGEQVPIRKESGGDTLDALLASAESLESETGPDRDVFVMPKNLKLRNRIFSHT